MMEFWAGCEQRLQECCERLPIVIQPRRQIPLIGFDGKLENLPFVRPSTLAPLLENGIPAAETSNQSILEFTKGLSES